MQTAETSSDLNERVCEVVERLMDSAWVGSGRVLGVDSQSIKHIRVSSVVRELAQRSELKEGKLWMGKSVNEEIRSISGQMDGES